MLRLSRCCRAFSSSVAGGLFVVKGELTQLPIGTIPSVGLEAQLTHAFSCKDTSAFAQLSGDDNPLHVSAEFSSRNWTDKKPIVQGLLSASLFATIVGRTMPGALYVKQTLRWRSPLMIDESVTARVRVLKVRKRFVKCDAVCTKTSDGIVVVEGQAILKLPPISV
ncbi:acyl dehydratase [Plasmopara halstedii]|uniref:Acyl dehydratase n=1 Tax=Plasmopara halstedii TaxID=4781 RepID=A0A0P1AR76_PLAHL|nr:acyl dehydratase [Plasmopara halstedii]CEG43393.1 acyl dehydratase [Plasmopara halstedii]|eukprot:XP_024579762.1 acyl dehydratase [Plasmopara halstedii]